MRRRVLPHEIGASRLRARLAGKRFYHGKPCAKGCDSRLRYTANGACAWCSMMASDERTKTGKGRVIRARQRQLAQDRKAAPAACPWSQIIGRTIQQTVDCTTNMP